MHIMHVLGGFGHGGAEMGVVRLINKNTDPSVRHSVCSFGSDVSMAQFLPADAECYSLEIKGRNVLAFRSLHRLLKKTRTTLVHVNNLAPWFDAALAAKIAGIPCIQTFHGVENFLISNSSVKKLVYRSAHKMTRTVTAVSQAAASLLHTISGIPLESIVVIPNGIDTDDFSPVENADRKRLLRKESGLPETNLIFGCVAALRPVKNHEGMIRSFARASREYGRSNENNPLPLLVLIGTGPLEPDLKQLAKDLACDDLVIFTGQQSGASVRKLLRSLDVFVLNSHTEGLSYALLEAMASGLPSVVTSVGSNPELVQHGSEGLLVRPGDEVDLTACFGSILENPKSLASMALNARRKSMTYSFSQMNAAYACLYQAATIA